MKTSEIGELLSSDSTSKRGDVYTVRKTYYYKHGYDAMQYASKVKSVFPDAIIIDYGDHWAPFRGGDSVERGSHWYVKFKLPSGSVPRHQNPIAMGGYSVQSGLPNNLRL